GTNEPWQPVAAVKRTVALIFAALAAAVLFGVSVHVVLVAAHLSEPAATTVRGATPQRLWATTVAVLALGGVVIGVLALARAGSAARGLLPEPGRDHRPAADHELSRHRVPKTDSIRPARDDESAVAPSAALWQQHSPPAQTLGRFAGSPSTRNRMPQRFCHAT